MNISWIIFFMNCVIFFSSGTGAEARTALHIALGILRAEAALRFPAHRENEIKLLIINAAWHPAQGVNDILS